jgi:opacity protein-like surface antigen
MLRAGASADGGTYVRSNAWDFVLVGMLHFASPVSLYGKLGYFRGAQEGGGTLAAPKELVDGLTYGGGVQFQATKNFAVRGEWQSYPEMGGGPVLRTGDITVFRLGALWRFQ